MVSRRMLLTLLCGVCLLTLILFTGSPTALAGPNDVVINEIMQNPAAASDAAGEWVEPYNAGADGSKSNFGLNVKYNKSSGCAGRGIPHRE